MSNAAVLIIAFVVFGILGPMALGCLTGGGERKRKKEFFKQVVPHINGAVSSDDGKKLWVADEWYFYLGAKRYRLEDYGYTEKGEWFLSGSMCIDFSSGHYDCVTLHGKLKNSVKNQL